MFISFDFSKSSSYIRLIYVSDAQRHSICVFKTGVLLLTETDVIEERSGDKDERNVSLKSSESSEDEA